MKEQKSQRGKINCFSCQFFYITHETRFPYGCKAAGFKSRAMPSLEMYKNSGMECQLFQAKERKG